MLENWSLEVQDMELSILPDFWSFSWWLLLCLLILLIMFMMIIVMLINAFTTSKIFLNTNTLKNVMRLMKTS